MPFFQGANVNIHGQVQYTEIHGDQNMYITDNSIKVAGSHNHLQLSPSSGPRPPPPTFGFQSYPGYPSPHQNSPFPLILSPPARRRTLSDPTAQNSGDTVLSAAGNQISPGLLTNSPENAFLGPTYNNQNPQDSTLARSPGGIGRSYSIAPASNTGTNQTTTLSSPSDYARPSSVPADATLSPFHPPSQQIRGQASSVPIPIIHTEDDSVEETVGDDSTITSECPPKSSTSSLESAGWKFPWGKRRSEQSFKTNDAQTTEVSMRTSWRSSFLGVSLSPSSRRSKSMDGSARTR